MKATGDRSGKWVFLAVALFCSADCMRGPGNQRVLTGEKIRVRVSGTGAGSREVVQIRDSTTWVDALDSHGSVLQEQAACAVESTDHVGSRIVIKGKCDRGTF